MSGAPDPVLLLHGQPGAGDDWDRVRAAIGSRAQTIAISRPGWDGSPPTGLEGNAEAALAALDERSIARATVAGHSFGGAVAAWLAALHPERVSSLVLVAPAANTASLNRLDYWLATPLAGYLASVTSLAGLGAALSASPLRRWLAGQLALDDRYLRAVSRRVLAPAAWRAYAAEQQVLVHELPELERALGSITAPTTIIAGSDDHVVPVEAERRLATQIPHAELVLLEHTGHLLLQQQAERLAELILGLASKSGSTAEG
jgi:pimeloyl-ACP methyl ester carboxylesterase